VAGALRNSVAALLVSLALAAGDEAGAQNSLQRGDYTLHYAVLPTRDVAPEVADRYLISRAAGRVLLSLTVLHRSPHGERAVRARVQGEVHDVADPRASHRALALREVMTDGAPSYLAEPRVEAPVTLKFELQVQPEGTTTPIPLRFIQSFEREPR
jgi:hypothetical protein